MSDRRGSRVITSIDNSVKCDGYRDSAVGPVAREIVTFFLITHP